MSTNHHNEIGTEIVNAYCKRFPNTPALTLAKKIFKENPKIFTTLETLRGMVRYRFGQNGNRDRKRAENNHKNMFREKGSCNPFGIPEPEHELYETFVLPTANNRILHIQDWHIPYHDVKTIELAIEYGKSKDVNTLVIGHDFIDFYQLSRFMKDPRRRNIKHEIEQANLMLDVLQKALPKAKIFFKNGNHDERLENFLRVKAPELLDFEEFKLQNLLRFGQRGITFIEDKRKIKAGNLYIMHGHEFWGGATSSVNPARGLFLKTGYNTLCGHFHKTSTHTDPNIEDELHGCWSVGSACNLHPEYARINKWNNGFAYIIVNKDGSFHVNNLMVYNGKIL